MVILSLNEDTVEHLSRWCSLLAGSETLLARPHWYLWSMVRTQSRMTRQASDPFNRFLYDFVSIVFSVYLGLQWRVNR